MVIALKKIASFLANYASLFVIASAIVAFLFPEWFAWVKGNTQKVILGLIMLTMGLTLSTNDFKILFKRPLDIFLGACSQFLLMPLIAYTLVSVFHLQPAIAIGILLVGCCPGGVSSNIMSFLCHGDVAFSVGMTCASTLLAPVMTPLLMQITANEIVSIDMVGMFRDILLLTILPVSIGTALNFFCSSKSYFPTLQAIMPGTSVVCLALIVGGVTSFTHDDLLLGGWSLFLLTFAVVFCHNTLGYITGFLVGMGLRFNQAKKRTISIEVGMQNAGLATTLAPTFFPAFPIAVLPCAISCVWHSISGTILAGIFASLDRRHKNPSKV